MRVVLLAGPVQVRALEDFSLQELTNQEPGWATFTAGAVKEVAEPAGFAMADAVTAELPGWSAAVGGQGSWPT